MTLAHYHWKKRAKTNTNELLMLSDTVTNVLHPKIKRFLLNIMWKTEYMQVRGAVLLF